MEINREQLQVALEKVKPGIASKEVIEQSTSFTFLAGRVATYNDEISISHPVPGLDVVGAVKAEALYGFLSKVTKPTINIEWGDSQINISAGKAKVGLVFESEIKLPLKEEIGELDGWMPVPKNFVEALKFVHPCCSSDMTRPVLTCVHVEPEKVEASDGYQIVKYILDFEGKPSTIPESFLIPASSVKDIVKYEVKEYTITDSWVHFRTNDGTIISSRIVNSEFPDTAAHLQLGGGITFEFPKNTQEILERANVFTKRDASADDIPVVTISIGKDGINISAQNEFGWFAEDAQIENYSGENIKFRVGSEFMLSIIDKIKKCEIDSGKIGFRGAGWTHVIAMLAETEAI